MSKMLPYGLLAPQRSQVEGTWKTTWPFPGGGGGFKYQVGCRR